MCFTRVLWVDLGVINLACFLMLEETGGSRESLCKHKEKHENSRERPCLGLNFLWNRSAKHRSTVLATILFYIGYFDIFFRACESFPLSFQVTFC